MKEFSLAHGWLATLSTFISGVSASTTPSLSHSSPPSSSVTGWPLRMMLRTWSTTLSLPTTELILNQREDCQSMCNVWAERLINTLKYSYIQTLIFSLILYYINLSIVLSKNPLLFFVTNIIKKWRWKNDQAPIHRLFLITISWFPLHLDNCARGYFVSTRVSYLTCRILLIDSAIDNNKWYVSLHPKRTGSWKF